MDVDVLISADNKAYRPVTKEFFVPENAIGDFKQKGKIKKSKVAGYFSHTGQSTIIIYDESFKETKRYVINGVTGYVYLYQCDDGSFIYYTYSSNTSNLKDVRFIKLTASLDLVKEVIKEDVLEWVNANLKHGETFLTINAYSKYIYVDIFDRNINQIKSVSLSTDMYMTNRFTAYLNTIDYKRGGKIFYFNQYDDVYHFTIAEYAYEGDNRRYNSIVKRTKDFIVSNSVTVLRTTCNYENTSKMIIANNANLVVTSNSLDGSFVIETFTKDLVKIAEIRRVKQFNINSDVAVTKNNEILIINIDGTISKMDFTLKEICRSTDVFSELRIKMDDNLDYVLIQGFKDEIIAIKKSDGQCYFLDKDLKIIGKTDEFITDFTFKDENKKRFVTDTAILSETGKAIWRTPTSDDSFALLPEDKGIVYYSSMLFYSYLNKIPRYLISHYEKIGSV